MSLKIGNHLFTGPFPLAETVIRHNHARAVFAVVVKEGLPWDPVFRLLAIGISPPQGMAFTADPCYPAWVAASQGLAVVYLHTATDTADGQPHDLDQVVTELNAQYGPAGGIVTLSNGV